ncbi:MAG TPA: hypothetical protein VF719_02605, partial [Abditibacteriaceae bacterium]
MNFPFSPRFSPRDVFARFFVTWVLFSSASLFAARAQESATPPISNASPGELQQISTTIDGLERAARARDANALAFFGASVPADDAPIKVTDRITHVAVSPGGALVRQVFALSIERKPAVVLSSGAQELWLSRAPNGGFALTPRRFMAPPDALGAMIQAAQGEWSGEHDGPAVLDLVASRIGGRWIALRRQRWDGELSNPSAEDSAMQPRDFLSSRMRSAPKNRAVIAHFMLQRGQRGWFGLGASYDFARRIPASADSAASLWRERIAGSDYLTAASHRDFGSTLGVVGLWSEA